MYDLPLENFNIFGIPTISADVLAFPLVSSFSLVLLKSFYSHLKHGSLHLPSCYDYTARSNLVARKWPGRRFCFSKLSPKPNLVEKISPNTFFTRCSLRDSQYNNNNNNNDNNNNDNDNDKDSGYKHYP